jgi:hypothetical protein
VTGDEKAKISQAKPGPGNSAFIEVAFPDDAIYPGSLKLARRTVRLRLTAPVWSPENDWSAGGLAPKLQVLPRVPLYDAKKLVGGVES